MAGRMAGRLLLSGEMRVLWMLWRQWWQLLWQHRCGRCGCGLLLRQVAALTIGNSRPSSERAGAAPQPPCGLRGAGDSAWCRPVLLHRHSEPRHPSSLRPQHNKPQRPVHAAAGCSQCAARCKPSCALHRLPTMASKDPFNFDELYKQAGMDGLVKKSMAEQKASMASSPAGSRASTTPPRPAANGSASSPARPGSGHKPLGSRPSPTAAGGAGAGMPHSGSTGSLGGQDDPFANLGGISRPPPMGASRCGGARARALARVAAARAAPHRSAAQQHAADSRHARRSRCVGCRRPPARSPTPPAVIPPSSSSAAAGEHRRQLAGPGAEQCMQHSRAADAASTASALHANADTSPAPCTLQPLCTRHRRRRCQRRLTWTRCLARPAPGSSSSTAGRRCRWTMLMTHSLLSAAWRAQQRRCRHRPRPRRAQRRHQQQHSRNR